MADIKLDTKEIYELVTNQAMTHQQVLFRLAGVALGQMDTLRLPKDFLALRESGVIDDMGEGFAPFAPRYTLPDYQRLMEAGCAYLGLAPPTTLAEAIGALEVFYLHVPSVTHYPVYLGRLDRMLEPFIRDVDEARGLIKGFLTFVDKAIPDSYCHVNLGPEATKAGELIVELQAEMQSAVPSITLLYDPQITPDAFAEKCVTCALSCAKPSFANHAAYSALHQGEYGIASCYNALKVGGGAFTLSRIILKNAAEQAESQADFFDRVLPQAVDCLCAFMEEKIRFLVEESHFFSSSFLVKEGFLRLERFTGMFGVVGLCECVNTLLEKEGRPGRFGHDQQADALGHRIMQALEKQVAGFTSKYAPCTGNHFALHAQVGIDSDIGVSPGARIAIGDELPLEAHLRHAGSFHPYFPSGVGDIFPFDATSERNPAAVLDIVKGAFQSGMLYFSTYSSDCDVVRITGYLVKRSDMELLERGEAVRQNNAAWGLGAVKNNRVLERKARSL